MESTVSKPQDWEPKSCPMEAVLFDTFADCRGLREALRLRGVKTAQLLFGVQEEKTLFRALEDLQTTPERSVLITNRDSHAVLAQRSGLVCIGCAEGTFPLPRTRVLLEEPELVSVAYLARVYCHERGLPATIAETQRCIVREHCPEDAKELYRMSADRWLGGGAEAVSTLEQEREKLRAYLETVYPFFEYGYWSAVEKESGRVIGKVGFREGVLPLEIGYVLRSDVRGKGLATELVRALCAYAEQELAPGPVFARIQKGNVASRRVAEKCGLAVIEEEEPSALPGRIRSCPDTSGKTFAMCPDRSVR